MRFSMRFANQIVGTLVILALAILVFVIFMLGKKQGWFTHDPEYYTLFNSASGISTNMEIKYRGLTIGHVKKIYLEGNKVKVEFSILEDYAERVKEGSLVEVSVSPIGLGNSFIFYFGLGNELIPEKTEIPERNSEKGKEIVEKKKVEIPETGDGIVNLVNQLAVLKDLDLLIKTINTSLSGISSLSGTEEAEELTLGQIINNIDSAVEDLTGLSKTISDKISPIIENLEKVTNTISDPSGTLMTVLGSEGSLAPSIKSTIESLSGVIEVLEDVSKSIPTQLLPQINVLISEVNEALRKAQDVMTAVANNPLLRGGVPEHRETGPGAANPRNIDF